MIIQNFKNDILRKSKTGNPRTSEMVLHKHSFSKTTFSFGDLFHNNSFNIVPLEVLDLSMPTCMTIEEGMK